VIRVRAQTDFRLVAADRPALQGGRDRTAARGPGSVATKPWIFRKGRTP